MHPLPVRHARGGRGRPAGRTVELALNPDFSQVESDAAQIDVNTTFALSYPERRPFFQEGSDLFTTWLDAAYTRSINDPLAAAEITGRAGGSSIAYIGARDERSAVILPFEERSAIVGVGESWTDILRLRRNSANDSYVGALLTDRRLDVGGSGTLFGADGLVRPGGPYRFEWQLLASCTAEPDEPLLSGDVDVATFDGGAHTAAFDGESFTGHAVHAALRRSARLWSFDLGYREAAPTFRADNGFQTRNDFRRADAGTGFEAWGTLRPTRRLEIRPSYAYERLDLEDGTRLYAGYILRARLSYQFTRELLLSLATQYDDFAGGLDLEPLLMYRLDPFSIIYSARPTGGPISTGPPASSGPTGSSS